MFASDESEFGSFILWLLSILAAALLIMVIIAVFAVAAAATVYGVVWAFQVLWP
jgi:hypothetical protein